MSDAWKNILSALSETVDPADFKVWLSPISAEISGHTMSLSLNGGSGYMVNRLRKKFGDLILKAGSIVMGCRPEELELSISSAVSGKAQTRSDRGAAPAPVLEAACAARPAPAAFLTAPASGKAPAKLDQSRPAAAAPASPAALIIPDKDVQARPAAPAPAAQADRASRTMTPQTLVRTLPFNVAATRSGAALMSKQWRYSFDDFVVGPSNAMAMTAAQDVCRPRSFVETLFVSSEPGLGKTHIVQSAVRQILEDRGSSAKVAYFTGDEFYARFRMGLVHDTLDDFLSKVRALDFLLVDDIQVLSGKTKTQEALMSLVKHLRDRGSRVVFASRYQPKELKALDPQLLSLCCSGILAGMDAPSYAMRCEILRRKASQQQISLPEEVISVLAGALEGDVRTLESCLQTLMLRMRVLNAGATPDMALEVAGQFAAPKKEEGARVSIDDLIGFVSRQYSLTEQQICSCLRRRNFVEARNVLFYLARKHTGLTMAQIGARVNKRHSTVIKGISTVEECLTSDTSSARQIAHSVRLIEKEAGCAGR